MPAGLKTGICNRHNIITAKNGDISHNQDNIFRIIYIHYYYQIPTLLHGKPHQATTH